MATMATLRTGTGSYLWGASPYPYLESGPPLSAADLERERRWNWEAKERDNPHLRSSRAVTGYHIQATDGDIGHVEDFLVDDHSWAIRYMIVDTTNWWPGKKVLVAPAWIAAGGLGPFEGARDRHARADQEQSRVRSSPACRARLRDATVRPLWPTPLLGRVARREVIRDWTEVAGTNGPARAGTCGRAVCPWRHNVWHALRHRGRGNGRRRPSLVCAHTPNAKATHGSQRVIAV